MPEFQRCRDHIRTLLARGFLDQAAQRANLAIDASEAPPAAATAAVHFVGLAVRYATQGDRAAALESFDTALEMVARGDAVDDLRPRLYQNVAAALAEAGDHAGAAECLEAAIALGADAAAVWHGLGTARLHAGDPAGALEALEQAQRRRPSAASTAEIALATLAQDSSPESARRMLARLTASRPENSPVRWEFALGRAHELAGDRAAAATAYRRALERAEGELLSAERELARRFVRGEL